MPALQAPPDAAPPLGQFQRWNAWATDWKPLAAAAAIGIYVSGFVVRAVIAWDNSLGVLPALDFQYFAAGVVLLTPIVLLWLAFVGARRLVRRWVAWERQNASRPKRTDMVLQSILFLGLLLVALASCTRKLGFDLSQFEKVPIFAAVGAFLMMIVINIVRDRDDIGKQRAGAGSDQLVDLPSGDAKPGNGKVGRFAGWVSAVAGTTGLLLMGLSALLTSLGVALFAVVVGLFGLWLLPHVPQEIGGALPRCLVLDVEVKWLSSELAADLFDGTPPPIPSEVRRTREVAAHFSNSEFLIIRLPATPQMRPRTVEVKRAAIMATTSCPSLITRSA